MTAEEHLEELRRILENLESDRNSSIERLSAIQKQVTEADESFKALENCHAGKRAALEAEEKSLHEQIDKLKDQISVLRDEKQMLVNSNGTLKVDNSRLAEENDKYRRYEAQANKVLEAKDESLKARAKEITETEFLLANRVSFLPKKD